jgi:hypothetical protein
MRKLLLLALTAGALRAAVVSGEVVENQTGRRLKRALVAIQPVAGSGGAPFSTRTNNFGAFTFSSVPGGAYLVSASRRGFAPAQYGQKRWRGSGLPVFVEQNSSVTLVIRLPRLAAVMGTILDENDVGLPDHDVAAYRNTRPPQPVVRGRTDDRGVYRLSGLDPGVYLVRALAKKDEEEMYLPTFYRDEATVERAYTVTLDLDREVDRIDIHPTLGRLYTMSGQATASCIDVPVALTLVSDLGSETLMTDGFGAFRFNPMPPGQYELYAQVVCKTQPGAGPQVSATGMEAAYVPVALDHDRDVRFGLRSLPSVRLYFEGSQGQRITDLRSIQVVARKKELSGNRPPEALKIGTGALRLMPGRWDVAVVPTPDWFVSGFTSGGPPDLGKTHPEEWNEISLTDGGAALRFILAENPGAVHGVVKAAAEPAIGAPVFLEASDLPANRRLDDPRVTHTDIHGQYHFNGLAPGAYRVLSSFDFQMPEPLEMTNADAPTLHVQEGKDLQADLELYVVK